ncbi:MAG: sensor histidine kinase [Lacrimispora celerecrescens]|nr:sensor histidine kinase [Lacrimispora celerecrescens]
MNNIIQRGKFIYNNMMLQTKFTITHMVITTIPMLVMFFFFHGKLYDMVLADTIRTEQTASAMTMPQIDQLIETCLDAQKSLEAHPYYKKLFRLTGYQPSNWINDSAEASDLCMAAEDIVDGDYITNILIYLDIPEFQEIFHNEASSRIFRPMREARGSYWHGIFQGDRTLTSLFCPEFYLSPIEIRESGDMAYITKTSILYNSEYHTCYTAIYYSKAPFTKLLKNNLTEDTSVAYIINDRDSTVATSDDGLAGIYHFSYDKVRDFFMSSNNFVLRNILDHDVYAGFYYIRKADWFMVAVIPTRAIIQKSFLLMIGFFLIYLLCVLISFLIANRLSHSITNRISSVIGQMAKVRTEPPTPLPASLYHDEIGELINTYNYMTRMMNRLIEDQQKAAEDLRAAEFNSLQTQINPHFLYNTMDMINWLAKQGRTEEVSEAVVDLSRFYKLTLSRKSTLSTIADELEHVKTYVRLQNMRYHQIINFVDDMPDHMMDLSIPKLTFQPVVENSILHGLLEKVPKGGTIVITGWLEDNEAVILISDDGVGMDAGKISGILSGRGTSKNGTNIGVFNTHRRLEILYGPGYGLTYNSLLGKGTEVEIRIFA